MLTHTETNYTERRQTTYHSWDMYWEGYGTMERCENGASPSCRLREKPAWVHDTWTKTGLGAKDEKESADKQSPTLNGEGHDRAEKLQDNNAGGTERQGGEEEGVLGIRGWRLCSAKRIRSQADCCYGNWPKLIYRSAAHLEGCWLCFAKPKLWPRIRSSDWNKDGTEGSFLTLEW